MVATDNPSLMFLKISRSNTIKTKSSKRSQKAVLKVSTENYKVSKCLVWIHMVFSFLGPFFVKLKHPILKMFLKPVWEGKMHGVTKIGIFRPLFCVRMLGKSTNYSTGIRPL